MKIEDVLKIWQAASNPTGYSIQKLSNLTRIQRSNVKKIVQLLKDKGLIMEKWRGTFNGWVAIGNVNTLLDLDLEE